MSSEESAWTVLNQYIVQIVFMIGIVFTAAKWIDKKNKDKVDGLRYELIGDRDNLGVIPRLETGFSENIKTVRTEFAVALEMAKERQKILAQEVTRLRDREENERYGRRGKSISYDSKGEEEAQQ